MPLRAHQLHFDLTTHLTHLQYSIQYSIPPPPLPQLSLTKSHVTSAAFISHQIMASTTPPATSNPAPEPNPFPPLPVPPLITMLPDPMLPDADAMELRTPLDEYLKSFASAHHYSIPVSHSSADSFICHYECHRSGRVGKPKPKKPKPPSAESSANTDTPNAADTPNPDNTTSQDLVKPPPKRKRKRKAAASTSLPQPRVTLKQGCPFKVDGHFDRTKRTWTLVYVNTTHNHGPFFPKPKTAKNVKKPKTDPGAEESGGSNYQIVSLRDFLFHIASKVDRLW